MHPVAPVPIRMPAVIGQVDDFSLFLKQRRRTIVPLHRKKYFCGLGN